MQFQCCSGRVWVMAAEQWEEYVMEDVERISEDGDSWREHVERLGLL